jgi:hypothetical protein
MVLRNDLELTGLLPVHHRGRRRLGHRLQRVESGSLTYSYKRPVHIMNLTPTWMHPLVSYHASSVSIPANWPAAARIEFEMTADVYWSAWPSGSALLSGYR